jgi:hypothetical protein
MAHSEDEDEDEHVVSVEAAEAYNRFRRRAEGLEVEIVVEKDDLVVRGPGLHDFSARIDPNVWDTTRARGDC